MWIGREPEVSGGDVWVEGTEVTIGAPVIAFGGAESEDELVESLRMEALSSSSVLCGSFS